jgi:hypothetical protein
MQTVDLQLDMRNGSTIEPKEFHFAFSTEALLLLLLWKRRGAAFDESKFQTISN